MKKIKRLFCLAILVCTVLALCIAAHAENYNGICGDTVSWRLDTQTGVLTAMARVRWMTF